ncbi:BMP family ABC transporter substrate-binding protein [Paenibacillus polymyxa]|uniref:BMP family lipoprotein n=1 Tax=Paenibacillus TaxID=44249 RepID=UPI0008FC77A9|nr:MULTISPECIES: BMP family ABC transporter substrate-binding protein [Paenibacillus]APB70334.1 BMP family ABC transporter substrate-binding protein [Paenibacillus polymyxa]OMF46814.1 BMP family ABC transporter substrate-binding protein [Paenibacillus peoriae]QYK63301.1 Membrane lipoprotein TmpC [Paenibacillus sp. S25]
MKKRAVLLNFRWIPIVTIFALLLSACGHSAAQTKAQPIKVGIVLSDIGLGDQSYSDAAFRGLVKARDEGKIVFEYREITETKTYDAAFEQLAQEKADLIIGLGYMVKDSLESIAKKYPDRKFLIVDEKSDLPNVASISFKAEEGSFMAGVVAGLTSRTEQVGFLGGAESPLLKKFEIGYRAGVQSVKPNAKVTATYAGDFGKPELGTEIADDMINQDQIDVIFAAAGLTGVGALQEAQKQQKLAIGVDSDQFFIAEKAVVTSMFKNVDIAIYTAVKGFADHQRKFTEKDMVFGLAEDGVGLAPIRVVTLNPDQQKLLDDLKEKIKSGTLTVPTQ